MLEVFLRHHEAMPTSYEIDTERELVLSRIWGAPTEDEILDHGRRLRADPRFQPEFRQLLDMTELTEILITPGTVRQASRDQFFAPGVRRALVAGDDVSFGMARMYAIASESQGQTIQVFRQLEGAKAWLGVSETSARTI